MCPDCGAPGGGCCNPVLTADALAARKAAWADELARHPGIGHHRASEPWGRPLAGPDTLTGNGTGPGAAPVCESYATREDD